MTYELDAATVVKEARRQSGLTQRELASRAGTSQSVVARIETGVTSPSVDTLTRLLKAAGFAMEVELRPGPAPGTHMLDDVRRILSLSPEERLLEARNLSRFERSARRV